MRILLVDDEEELVATLAERLFFRGIEADWSTNVEDAIHRVETQAYDLALLDVKIPRMSGFELKKKLKGIQPDMKFIFVTGHGSENDFDAGLKDAGSGYYLLKPVKIDALIEKIKEALGREIT